MIMVFNNDLVPAIPNEYIENETNELVVYHFGNRSSEIWFKHVFTNQDVVTPTGGRGKYFPGDSILYLEATDQAFFVISDLRRNKTYKCVIPGRTKKQIGNPGWFRLMN